MSKHKHRHRHEEDKGNSNSSPNMLGILILILSFFGNQKPIYNFDEELLNNQHNKASKKGAWKESDPGYTGGSVLSKDIDSQDEAGSHESYGNNKSEDIGYTDGRRSDCELPQNEESFCIEGDKNNEVPQYEAYRSECNSAEDNSRDINLTTEGCGAVIEREVVPEYPSKFIIPEGNCSTVVITVPVVLTQFEIEFASEAVITLDQPAIDIKRIKKNVFLDQCRLLPKVNKLFVGGIIRKNIEYGTKDNIRHTTVEVPFKFTTVVEYLIPPVISSTCEQVEVEALRLDGIGADLTEKTYINREYFNERIYCKLVSDEIREIDVLDEDRSENESPECETLSETVTEKMVVRLNIKLVQEQEIAINN